jgi:hypothetical protein
VERAGNVADPLLAQPRTRPVVRSDIVHLERNAVDADWLRQREEVRVTAAVLASPLLLRCANENSYTNNTRASRCTRFCSTSNNSTFFSTTGYRWRTRCVALAAKRS